MADVSLFSHIGFFSSRRAAIASSFMRRQDNAAELDDDAGDVDEVDEKDFPARREAEDEALLEAHAGESSLPWHLLDLFFRPRLAALRWTQAADDRLRDRAVAILAVAAADLLLQLFLRPGVATDWGFRAGLALGAFVWFLVMCIMLAGTAKVFDTIGRGLGAEENYDRLRVVLAMLLVPQLVVLIPIHLFRFFFGESAPTYSDHPLKPVGIDWLFVGAYVIWLSYFPLIALQTVQRFPLGKALGNCLLGLIGTVVFWAVSLFILYLVLLLNVRLFHWDPLNIF